MLQCALSALVPNPVRAHNIPMDKAKQLTKAAIAKLAPADQRHYAVYLYMQKHNATMAKACQAVYNCFPDSAAAAKDAMQHKRWEK